MDTLQSEKMTIIDDYLSDHENIHGINEGEISDYQDCEDDFETPINETLMNETIVQQNTHINSNIPDYQPHDNTWVYASIAIIAVFIFFMIRR